MTHKLETIHLPDLLFVRFCEDQFGINRGVYNTIDLWLFQKGIIDILERRKHIHQFLATWYQNHGKENCRKIRIGPGNLTNKLTDYYDDFSLLKSKRSEEKFVPLFL